MRESKHRAPRGRLRVKFSAIDYGRTDVELFRRQLPEQSCSWGDCQFLFDPDERDYDWLVCYDDLAPLNGERFSTRVEPLACPPEHTLLITVEPSSIKIYGRDFLDQFGVVLTSQEPWAINSDRAVFSQPALRWFYGCGEGTTTPLEVLRSADPPGKTRQISTVCSNKRHHCTLHARRVEYTTGLAERIPELDVFGRGVLPIDDKAEAIDPYRYHLAVENHLAPHHWTEKLADAFLGWALPLYVGCPNVTDYFPEESLIQLSIADLETSAQRIREVLREDQYQKRLPAIVEARRRVIEQYSLFAVVSDLIQRHHTSGAVRTPGGRLFSRHAVRRQSVAHAMRFQWERIRTRGRSRRRVRRFVKAIAA